jgi:hypothetical protein
MVNQKREYRLYHNALFQVGNRHSRPYAMATRNNPSAIATGPAGKRPVDVGLHVTIVWQADTAFHSERSAA